MNREAILQEAREVGFDGATYLHERDGLRLSGLMGRAFDCVKSGEWFTLAKLSELTGGSESGCAARLRDLRKERFGGFEVERIHTIAGIHLYRLKPPQAKPAPQPPAPRRYPGTTEERLQVAIAALQLIAKGEGAPRPAGGFAVPFPKWAQFQSLAKRCLQELGE